ncbi:MULTISPECIES: DUF5802 family protein [Halobacterium]|uniref:Uncharacterized protein n=4 Tax=Halobacterium salinarum TaxID=2242 RepID=A0A510N7T2_HALSA|nr:MULTISPECIES: DUF5802 family protein [Halobacterium]MBB6089058.1 hypothetical protein [Halobacterium salinarum]MCF2238817.1 hypothetical protein [Halobacterium salinarum]MDL0119661.1 DUF5802 family protein [Halobacterium salinarum]MDL0123313.1 DUF5802 family protein [Halobacterium salinarum]MDL0132221.1 DUF5802 family protein [Halobacterium salinarum]
MFEAFSSGYYLGRLYVEPADTGRAAINRSHHQRVNEQLYTTAAGVSRTDLPLVMKLGGAHLAVDGQADVPQQTLAVPADRLDDLNVDNPPTLSEVLLAKRDHAARLLDIGAV